MTTKILLNHENKLSWNYILDLKKKECNKFERAIIIRNYLKNNNLSERGLSALIGVPKSTVQDWLLFDRLTEEEYNNLLKTGLNESDIYRILRNGKKLNKEDIVNESKLNYTLKGVLKSLKGLLRFYSMYSSETTEAKIETKDLLKEVRNTINRLMLKTERD